MKFRSCMHHMSKCSAVRRNRNARQGHGKLRICRVEMQSLPPVPPAWNIRSEPPARGLFLLSKKEIGWHMVLQKSPGLSNLCPMYPGIPITLSAA